MEAVVELVVWVVEGTDVVTTVVAGAVVWAGDTVWVAFAAPTGSTTINAQTRTTKNTIGIVPREILTGDLFKMFHRILLII